MIDHARSRDHGHQQERADELDDQPDPQRPRLKRLLFEPDQVAAPEGSLMPLLLITYGTGGDVDPPVGLAHDRRTVPL
jgi:hypothetical protein